MMNATKKQFSLTPATLSLCRRAKTQVTASISVMTAMGILLLTGCATDTGRPLSANGQPLQLQIKHATVTSQAQTFYGGIALPDFAASVSAGNTTYNGRVENIYGQHTPKPSESFLIVEFKISGVLRTLQLAPGDVFITDGKGGFHQTLGVRFPDDKWYPFDFLTVSPESAKAKKVIVSGINTWTINAQYSWEYEKWIFSIPHDAVNGATISLQGNKYPLKIDE
jgi:hypothetical protein